MKTFSFLIIGLSILLCGRAGFCTNITDNPTGITPTASSKTTLSITSSPDLSGLATSWTHEFVKAYPSMQLTFDVSSDGQPKTGNNLCIVSDDYFQSVSAETAWKMVIARDAIIPVVSANNPLIDEIGSKGITAEEFAKILTNSDQQNWAIITNGNQNAKIHLFCINNEGIKTNISKFTQQNINAIQVTFVSTPEEMASSLQKDSYAIGICRTTDVLNATTNEFIADIKVLPIDKNRNGRIDSFENIYTDLKSFTRGVWIGKYPNALCGNIYAVSSSKPTEQTALEFLKWINAEGQQYLNKNGFGELSSAEKTTNLDALAISGNLVDQTAKPLFARTWLMVILAFFVTAIILIGAARFARNRKKQTIMEDIEITPAFNENSILAPKGLHFDKTHTWAFMEKDGIVKMGIDDFLQHITGPITRISMKTPGEKIRRGEKILTLIRNGKQMNIYAPISGVIKEQNQALLTDASILNSAPYSDGWVYAIEPKNWLREIQFLFMAAKYKEWLQDEFTRLRDFLAASINSNSAVYTHVILQDGGELTDHILADLGPEVWEDFQTNFIDTSK